MSTPSGPTYARRLGSTERTLFAWVIGALLDRVVFGDRIFFLAAGEPVFLFWRSRAHRAAAAVGTE